MARRTEVVSLPGFEGRIVGVVGTKDTGKTRVVEVLVKYLRHRGYSVGTVKHVHGKVALEPEAADSARHFAAGAGSVVTMSGDAIYQTAEQPLPDPEAALAKVCTRYLGGFDYVIVEGFKEVAIPKIVVTRRAGDIPRNLANTVAYVHSGPKPKGLRLPAFTHSEGADLGRFLLKSGILAKPGMRVHLAVNEKPIPMNEFVRSALAGVLEGFITRLRDIEPPDKIEITVSNLRKK